MSKHTKGPWKAKRTRGNNYFEYTLYKIVGALPGKMASIGFADSESAEANAHLIAAAPQLLEACKQAVCGNMGWKGKLEYAITAAEPK